MSPYWCRFEGCIPVDTCGFFDVWVKNSSEKINPDVRYDFEGYREDILAFARDDLKAVNRTKTPWVIVTGHYPFYESYDRFHPKNVASERKGADGRARGRGSVSEPSKAQALADFEPILKEYAVDIFFPDIITIMKLRGPFTILQRRKRISSIQQLPFISYRDPQARLSDVFTPVAPVWSRNPRLQVNSYSRIVAYNNSVLYFEQVANDNASVVDSFSIRKSVNKFIF